MAENVGDGVPGFSRQCLGTRVQGDLSGAGLADHATEDQGGRGEAQAWVFDLRASIVEDHRSG